MINELFLFSLNNLKARKLRSWLTILGIIIGIAAIVALMLVSKGLKASVEEQFERFGVNTLSIAAGPSLEAFSLPIGGLFAEKGITEDDLEVVKKVPGVKKALEIVVVTDITEINGEKFGTVIHGLSTEDIDLIFGERGYKIIEGRNLRAESEYEAIIGNDLLKGVYKKIGKVKIRDRIKIKGKDFVVVGSLEKTGERSHDASIFIPIESLREVYDVGKKIDNILVEVQEGRDAKQVAEKIREKLRKERNEKEGEETFTVTTSRQLLEIFTNIIAIIQFVVVGIAAISLVVGGIGIMNTMYTSVLERTKQIGIMKAVGAKDNHILIIFIIEAGLIGLVGGIIGTILGIFGGKLIELAAIASGFYLLKIVLDLKIIVLGLLFAFFVGVISGIMPARQAAKLNPVEALRYE
ncbi:MAG: ABC transporter permease [Candidatus Pacearchaeota archaeon]